MLTKEVTLEDVPLEEVEYFCYLGSIIDGKDGTEADVKARIGKARAAFRQLGKVWRATKIEDIPNLCQQMSQDHSQDKMG